MSAEVRAGEDAPEYRLGVRCLACNRGVGEVACGLCRAIEFAEVSGAPFAGDA